MTASSALPAPNLMPLMRYRELAEAMSWLERAFDFEKQIAVADGDGAVIYGQMTYRGGLLMLGAIRDTELDKLMRQPDEVGGAETQSCYIVVEDADQHYAKARAAGAEILLDIKSDGLGRRGYSCRDPQGHIWNFGTYSPGRGLATSAATASADEAPASAPPRRRRATLLMTALILAALGATGWWLGDGIKTGALQQLAQLSDRSRTDETSRAYAELVKVRGEKREADAVLAETRKALAAERTRRQSLESDTSSGGAALANAEKARTAAEGSLAALRAELQRTQAALDDAKEARRVSEDKLAAAQAEAAARLSASQAPRSPAASLPAPAPAGEDGSKIETSATQTVAPPGKEPADDDNRRIAERTSAKPRARSKKPSPVARRLVPTYMVEMRSVPWPYAAWYAGN